MTLIGVVLALLAERALGDWRANEPSWLLKALAGAQTVVRVPAFWNSPAAPLLVLVLLTAGTALIDVSLERPLVHVFYGAAILFLCLDPRPIASDIHKLIEAREQGDEAAERTLTRTLLRGPERDASRRSLVGALFIQAHERQFGVLLWFIIAGPAGAVFYRVASRLHRFVHEGAPESESERLAVTLHAAAAWIPARLTALLFGLAGSLDQALHEWRRQHSAAGANWRDQTWAVLAEVSAAAVAVDEPADGVAVPASLPDALREVKALQQRALLILLAAFGLFSAGGLLH